MTFEKLKTDFVAYGSGILAGFAPVADVGEAVLAVSELPSG